jgi:hypothetical protein
MERGEKHMNKHRTQQADWEASVASRMAEGPNGGEPSGSSPHFRKPYSKLLVLSVSAVNPMAGSPSPL